MIKLNGVCRASSAHEIRHAYKFLLESAKGRNRPFEKKY